MRRHHLLRSHLRKKIAHCFGCGKGGNIFQFVSLIENITYNQAIVKLGTRLGLDIESNNNKEESYDLNNELDINVLWDTDF